MLVFGLEYRFIREFFEANKWVQRRKVFLSYRQKYTFFFKGLETWKKSIVNKS